MKNLCDVWEGGRGAARGRCSFWVKEDGEDIVARVVQLGLWFGALAGMIYGINMLLNLVEQWALCQVVSGMSF